MEVIDYQELNNFCREAVIFLEKGWFLRKLGWKIFLNFFKKEENLRILRHIFIYCLIA